MDRILSRPLIISLDIHPSSFLQKPKKSTTHHKKLNRSPHECVRKYSLDDSHLSLSPSFHTHTLSFFNNTPPHTLSALDRILFRPRPLIIIQIRPSNQKKSTKLDRFSHECDRKCSLSISLLICVQRRVKYLEN